MKGEPYKASHDCDGNHRVHGPGNGFGYYAATLWPNLACASKEECERAATMCNTAYAEGYAAAQRAIREAIGA